MKILIEWLTFILILLCLTIIGLLLLVATAPDAEANCDEVYLKVGTGYKFAEQNGLNIRVGGETITYKLDNDRISARFEAGVECGRLTWGVAHHSQWFSGYPFNDRWEYHKTEFFVDYKFSWGL